VQLCNTGANAQKTGSLYNFQKIEETPVADDQWSRQTIAVIGNRILIQVNGNLLVGYPDKESTYTEGAFSGGDITCHVTYDKDN